VALFQMKNKLPLKKGEEFFKISTNIKCPTSKELDRKEANSVGVYFMSFTTDNKYLVLYYQEIEAN